MKDQLGLYYYPTMGSKENRMYVRQGEGAVEFRMWHRDYPEIWERHGWVPYDAVVKASDMYKEKKDNGRNPLALYDIEVAKRLIAEDGD